MSGKAHIAGLFWAAYGAFIIIAAHNQVLAAAALVCASVWWAADYVVDALAGEAGTAATVKQGSGND